MAVTCAVSCACGCMEVDISAIYVNVGGKAYMACSCDDAASPAVCCDADTPTGLARYMDDGGHFAFTGEPAVPGSKCNCVFAGAMRLCEDGDWDLSHLIMDVVIWIFDNEAIYVEATLLATTYRAYAQVGVSCILSCYDREYGLYEDTFTPIYGPPYLVAPHSVELTCTSDFAMTVTLSTPSAQEACKTGRCVVSHRARTDTIEPDKTLFTPRVMIADHSQGRCPTVSSPAWALTKDTGWQCLEEIGKEDCNGDLRPDLFEYITHRGGYFPPVPEDPCELQCADLFLKSNYCTPLATCGPFDDPAAWWSPASVDSWDTSPRYPCAQAARDGWVVWRLVIFCSTYYKAFDPAAIDYPPTKENFWLYLTAPCGADCAFTELSGCCAGAPLYVDDLVSPRAHPNEIVDGMTPGNCLGVVGSSYRQKVDTYYGTKFEGTFATYELLVSETPLAYKGSYGKVGGTYYRWVESSDPHWILMGQTEYPRCQLESYEVVTECIDPTAPDIDLDIYDCPNCPECYEDNGDLKDGFGVTNMHEETFYGDSRAAAVDAAVAYAEWAVDQVEANDNVVPFHCCDGSTWNTWQDEEHTVLCDWGIKYLSTEKISVDPDPELWRTIVVFCCQCIGSWICCTADKTETVAPFSDMRFTDFFGPVVDYNTCPDHSRNSVADEFGVFCRDLDTGFGMYQAWKSYVVAELGRDCWEFLGAVGGYPTHPGHYYCTSTVGSGCMYEADTSRCSGGQESWMSNHPGYTNHAIVHAGSLVPDYFAASCDIPYTVDEERTGCTSLVCHDAGGGLMQWTGYLRRCFWCDGICDEAHGCTADPCRRVIGGADGAVWVTCYGYDFWGLCTEDMEAICIGYAADRLYNISGPTNYYPWGDLCVVSLGGQMGTGLTGCGIHFCAGKCGVDWMSLYPWSIERDMMQYFMMDGYFNEWPPSAAGLAAALAEQNTTCLSRCGLVVDMAPSYTFCEDCSDVCGDMLATWQAHDGMIIDGPYNDIFWNGVEWERYEYYVITYTDIPPVFLPPCGFSGYMHYVGPTATGPWTLDGGYGYWGCMFDYGYICGYDVAWADPGDPYGYTVCA